MTYIQSETVIQYPFTKPLMFAKVMEDPELCREFIERLFEGRKVKEVAVHGMGSVVTEATKIPGVKSKYVRLDVLFEDDASWYNIELQALLEEELPQRARYYSAVLDVTHLKSGDPYGDLKTSYVIFLCLFDFYEKKEPIYTFERVDRKKDLPCGDGSYIIILNSTCPAEKVPDGLRPLFHYVNTQEVDPEDTFVKTIHDRVLKYQSDEEVVFNMTLEEEYLREKTKATRKGREEGLVEGREEALARLNKLNILLLQAGRQADLEKSFFDPAYQQQLLKEFGLTE